jgi:peptidoglycan/LPS O-acetylase OafA/YrhL
VPIKKHFDSINLLRGFAAITVVIYHFIEINKWTEFPNSGLLLWFRAGWMAVDLFFVISGFVVGLSIFFEINSADKTPPISYRKKFFINRCARIIPLYFLTGLIVIIFVNPNLIFDHLLKNIFLHSLFLQNFFPEYLFSINGVTWTLGPEVQFYMILFLFGPWLLKTRVVNLIIIFIGTAWLYRYGIKNFIQGDKAMFSYTTNIFGVLDEFGVGFILARLYSTPLGAKVFTPSTFNRVILLSLVLVVGYVSQLIYFGTPNYFLNLYMFVFFKTLLAISFGLIVLLFCNLNFKGIFNVALYPLYYLGTISYGIYLWHVPILSSLNRVLGVPPILKLVVLLSTSILSASVTWYFFEKPIIARYRNYQKSV